MGAVKLKHICHVFSVDEGIVDGDEFNIIRLERNLSHQAPDPSEPVDSDLDP
jgi:hypothetical protein